MYNCYSRACVIEVILIIGGGQQRIDHRDHRSNARCTEPCPNKLRTIRQRNQHAIFNVESKLAQCISGLIRETCDLAICPLLLFKIETNLILPTFLQIVVEEVVSHIKMVWEDWQHFVPFCA